MDDWRELWGSYTFKRLLLIIPTLLVVTLLIFFLIRTIPGDVVTMIVSEQYFASGVKVDVAARTQMLKNLNVYILEECNVTPPPTLYMYSAWQPWLKGYHGEFSGGGTYGPGQMYTHVWVDQNIKNQ